ncbi:DsbA family protein [Clostridium sp. FP1]|uniref:DsbA family protein n=1 Tax=Clostridium sp. FP1 TaxID=2724076 RepID=UPI0013E91683|nr:DsbA family protein [Clostridium sp. FP1]MBZ9634713.1 DsbA family protein [Clostridium sp. FP1]
MKNKVYYIMDTMCGWCYGFSDVITRIHKNHKDKYDFEIIPGGMWIGDEVKTMDTRLGEFIKTSNVRVEALTGIHFGEGFNKNVLDSSDRILDSLPGAKAVVLFQKLNKDMSFDFVKKIQEAFFVNGEDMNDISIYSKIAESFGVSKEDFEKKFLSEELMEETFEYFKKGEKLGVQSFPTIILEKDNKRTIIAQGYSNFKGLDKILLEG